MVYEFIFNLHILSSLHFPNHINSATILPNVSKTANNLSILTLRQLFGTLNLSGSTQYVSLDYGVGVGVSDEIGVSVGVGVKVGTSVAVGVAEGVGVLTGVCVAVDVFVGILVGVFVGSKTVIITN